MNSKVTRSIGTKTARQRAAAAVWTAITAILMVGFAALAVDLGHMRLVKVQLQNAADAAALAGASALMDPAGIGGNATPEQRAQEARLRASTYAAKNAAEKKAVLLDPADITVGHITNPDNLQEGLAAAQPYNAVQTIARKNENSSNGPVSLFFAAIWGERTASLTATATALLDGRMYGYRAVTKSGKAPLIPVTVRRQKWTDEIVAKAGDDLYGYDPQTGQITNSPDGIPELSLYPEKQKDQDPEGEGGGDFGLLNIGPENQGVPELAEQIRNGINEENIVGAFGSPEIRFYDDNGSPITHVLDGTPGVKNSLIQLEDDFRSRLGDVIGFFVHTDVTESGANAQYDVVGMQFGRIMNLNARGGLNSKAVVIQPAAYVGREVLTDEGYSIHDTGARIRLIR